MKSNTHSGFTLLEVLVAMTLVVIVVAALYSTYFGLAQGRETAVAGMESRRELRATLDMLRRELSSALYQQGNKRLHFVVEDRDTFGKPASNLGFTTLGPPRSGEQPQSDQVALSYKSVVKDGRMTLVRQAKDLFFITDSTPYPQMDELEGFLVECQNGDSWVKSWNTELNGKLPTSVRVTIFIKEGDRTVGFSTVASPRMAQN